MSECRPQERTPLPSEAEVQRFSTSTGVTDDDVRAYILQLRTDRVAVTEKYGMENNEFQVCLKKGEVSETVDLVRLYRYVMSLVQGSHLQVDDLAWELIATAALKLDNASSECRAEFGAALKELWDVFQFENLDVWFALQSETEWNMPTLHTNPLAMDLMNAESTTKEKGHRGVGRRFINACKHARFTEVASALGLPHPQLDEADHALKHKYQTLCSALKLDHSALSIENSYRIQNFFLLWVHYNNPHLYPSGQPLLVTQERVISFLQLYGDGKLKRRNKTPYIVDVLDGVLELDHQLFSSSDHDSKSISSTLFKKMASTLSKLQDLQAALLGLTGHQRLAEDQIMKSMIRTVVIDAPFASRRHLDDRQHRIFLSGFDMSKKVEESRHYLEDGNYTALRTRAQTLAQTWSVSRFADAALWEFADLFPFVYSTNLHKELRQDIETIYVVQGHTKTRSDDMMPNLQLLCRHKDWEQCSLNAISLMLGYRFMILGDPFVPMNKDKSDWYGLKLFANINRPKEAMSSRANYERKSKALRAIDVHTSWTNHNDRHFGAMYCAIKGVDTCERAKLGGWSNNMVQSRYYEQLYSIHTVNKLCGFDALEDHYIERNMLDPFCIHDRDISAFVRSIMPELDDPDFLEAIKEKLEVKGKAGDSASIRCFDAMRLLRKIMIQDFPFVFEKYPHIEIFNSNVFKQHENGFRKWCELVKTCMNSIPSFQEARMTSPTNRVVHLAADIQESFDGRVTKAIERTNDIVARFEQMEETYATMKKLDTLISRQEQIMSSLEKVLTTMNCLETDGMQEDGCKKRQRDETDDVVIPIKDNIDRSHHSPSRYIIQHLKDLSSTPFRISSSLKDSDVLLGMNLWDVYEEQRIALNINNISYPPIEVLLSEKPCRIDKKKLKTKLLRRRHIVSYIEAASPDISIHSIKETIQRLESSELVGISLNRFWEKTRNYCINRSHKKPHVSS